MFSAIGGGANPPQVALQLKEVSVDIHKYRRNVYKENKNEILIFNKSLGVRTAMYTQSLNSGGGAAQRLNQHFK